MADIEAIRTLLFRACLANDERDGDMWASCWTDDAEMGGGARSQVEAGTANVFRGKDSIVHALIAAWGQQTHRRRHVLSNVFLLEDGEEQAVVNSYITLFLIENEGAPELEITGRYRDTVVRHDGAWKIQKREAVMDRIYRPPDAEHVEG
jgi:3-phenylpropionate/cinnamic acid dioxygenase small subunit